MEHRIIVLTASFRRWTPLLVLLAFLVPGEAHAACSNPTGSERTIMYNGDYHTYQFCNGTNWVAMGSMIALGSLPGVPPSLVAWWKLDDGSGTTAVDSSGNGNTLTLNNTYSWNAVGKIGGDIAFSDGSGYGLAPVSSILQITGSLTLTAWINMTAITPNDADDHIIDRTNSGWAYQLKGTQDCTGVNLQDNLALLLSYNGGTFAERCSNTIFALNTWYFVVGVYDASVPSIHLYVNGVNDDGAWNGGNSYVPTSIDPAPSSSTGIGQAFNGQIDDARVYSRALSSTEIAALYAVSCPSPSGPERTIMYNSDYHTYQFCNGASWVQMGQGSGGGGGGCSNPSGPERTIMYNGDYHTYQFCNGTNWVKFGGSS